MNKEALFFACMLCIALVGYFSGISKYLSFETLKQERQTLLELVDEYPKLSPLLFTLLYIIIVAFSIPGGTVLALTAGFLFPQPYATIYAAIGAATGACIIFYISTLSIGQAIREKAKNYGAARIEKGLKENEVIYLMLIRLIPIFPFWFVNIVPSVFGVKFKNFALSTFIGILPGSYVYSQAGNGLATALDSELENETLTSFLIKGMFNKNMGVAMSLLGCWLAFLLVLRYITRRLRSNKVSENKQD
eukprot:TRINITY_DN7026_c0_g1_i1.p1 TRINITY_DN7026_c0_g1~~TRINITY_DN7026_c0_g1_i1.p1  ORF type:complete len:248 (-),score=30.61 TRINITY_DN7026_c0_g1_i1:129-872(-)